MWHERQDLDAAPGPAVGAGKVLPAGGPGTRAALRASEVLRATQARVGGGASWETRRDFHGDLGRSRKRRALGVFEVRSWSLTRPSFTRHGQRPGSKVPWQAVNNSDRSRYVLAGGGWHAVHEVSVFGYRLHG